MSNQNQSSEEQTGSTYIVAQSPKSLGFSLFITVPLINLICVVWAYVGIKRYNEALMSGRLNV